MSPRQDDLGAPGSYVTLEEGTDVLSSDGERIGRVVEVRADTSADVFDGLVIGTGPLGADRRFLEAEAVEEIFERGVVLKLDAGAARELPPA